MIHVRIVAPPDLAQPTLDLLAASPATIDLIHVPGGSIKPPGDFVLCDIVREEASVVIDDLRELGLAERGSIAVEEVDTQLSELAAQAELAARGSPADAVVWEEVEARTSQGAELSVSFLAFMVVATLIAGMGILTDSQILIIGAMVVGPEFGPIAGFCVAVVQRRLRLARRSLVALAIGFPLAIVATFLVTLALRALGSAPETVAAVSRPATYFIADPGAFSVIVATLAGVAGVLSLTTERSGALTGVLISVTTIPAAANVGVAAAYGDWDEVGGALAQLGINLLCLMSSGIATLGLLRVVYQRRRRAAHERGTAPSAPASS
ncbi:MAG TPA: DUF389 domain-containing protein [Gaiellaceae bacterium]|nr:DUF389 domain-containing protein [Gaiellaceae bacterium]